MAETQGVVAILTAPGGEVVVSVSDFDRSGYGGFTQQEAQEMRAKRQLAYAAVRAFCSPAIVEAMEAADCERIIGRMIDRHGYRRTLLGIGYGA